MPGAMTHTVIAFYIMIYLLEVAELHPFYASFVIFSGRAWDAITDPLIGFYMDRLNCRLGKLKPWIYFSAPFAITCYWLLWSVPETSSQEIKLVYYTLFYCAFQMFLTCYSLPHAALTMYITHDQSERDSATAYRIWADIAGTVVGMIIQSQILIFKMGRTSHDPCRTTDDENQTDTKEAKNAFFLAGIIIGAFYAVCALVVALGVKEYRDDAVVKKKNESFKESLKTVFSHKPYITLLVTFTSFSLAMQTIQGNLVLYGKYSLEISNFHIPIIIMLVSALVSIPIWQYLITKNGKIKTFYTGMMMFVPVVVLLLVIPGNEHLLHGISVFSGAGVAVSFLLPWSMIPDVIDDFTVKTGTRKEAIFVSFYVFFNKFASGMALGISTLILGFAGYDTGACTQPPIVGYTLRILVSIAPLMLTMLGFKFLRKYPITEDVRLANKRALNEIRYGCICRSIQSQK
ncbi:sodium-dependent lysophosphatidylcholine symporter 1-B-like [Saccoglossus kowalevskii]